MRQLILIAHNVRSAHNVGSLFRTADGLAVTKIYLTGYSPYPIQKTDARLPHIAKRVDNQIVKTALGAEKMVAWRREADINTVLTTLKRRGYTVAALEQAATSKMLFDYEPPAKLAIVVGNEVEGLDPAIIEQCDLALEIQMFGRKESFNVVQAAAMALYHCRFSPDST